jgi:CarboxypepD_reg-like domain
MKKNYILNRATQFRGCPEKSFRIIRLTVMLLMVTVFNVFGGTPVSGYTDLNLDKKSDPAVIKQQNRITGTVTDEKDNPMPGVNIQYEETTVGTITDGNGKYALESPNQNAVLIFTFVGYGTQRVPVSGRKVIDIKMVPDLKSLGGVVVIGYGVQRKSDLTGSVGSVKAATYTGPYYHLRTPGPGRYNTRG